MSKLLSAEIIENFIKQGAEISRSNAGDGVKMSIGHVPLTSELLVQIIELPNLEELILYTTLVTDDALRELSKIETLKVICLYSCENYSMLNGVSYLINSIQYVQTIPKADINDPRQRGKYGKPNE